MCIRDSAKRKRRPGTITLDYPIEDQSVAIDRGKLLAEEMELALNSVRKEYRDAFLLFHKKELCYNEISEELGVPLGTVKTWVHRARRELIEKLKKRGAFSDV